jgi:hypothetical protein
VIGGHCRVTLCRGGESRGGTSGDQLGSLESRGDSQIAVDLKHDKSEFDYMNVALRGTASQRHVWPGYLRPAITRTRRPIRDTCH